MQHLVSMSSSHGTRTIVTEIVTETYIILLNIETVSSSTSSRRRPLAPHAPVAPAARRAARTGGRLRWAQPPPIHAPKLAETWLPLTTRNVVHVSICSGRIWSRPSSARRSARTACRPSSASSLCNSRTPRRPPPLEKSRCRAGRSASARHSPPPARARLLVRTGLTH